MATLKVETIHHNFIWLADIARVETLLYMYPKTGEELWDCLNRELAQLSSENLQQTIKDCTDIFINCYHAVGDGKLDLPQLVLVKVTYKDRESAQELWYLSQGKNFLMEDGKTVDRF